jgi:peptidoglycan hydrolase-like protein with peptidoglycan-binding domain
MPQVSSDKKVKQAGVPGPLSTAPTPAAAPLASRGYARDRSTVQPPPQRAARHPNAILGDTYTRGASAKTAAQDGLAPGVAASHQMAKTDLPEIAPHSEALAQVAAKYRLPPALLAAVISRESRGGKALDGQGRGDHGYGVGVMQVDTDYHKSEGGGWDRAHLEQGARILADQLAVIRQKHPDWPPALQLRGAVAAYNMGPAKVQTIAHMDVGSTGGDYSSDVWARAQYYAKHIGAEPAVTEAARPSAAGKTAPEAGLAAPAGGSRDERSTAGSGGSAGSGGPAGASAAGNKSQPSDFKGWYVKGPEAERVAAGRMLRVGHAGAAVREVQQRLGLEADGLFGPATEAAVKRFQAEHGLTPPPGREGNVGPTTLEWLRKTTAQPAAKPGTSVTPAPNGQTPATRQPNAPQPGQSAKQPPKPASDPRTAFEQAMQRGKVLGMGDSGPEVKGLQQALGLTSAGQTGRFGPTTEAQVKAFQRQHGLAVDGRVGPDTFGALQAGSGGGGGGDTISPAGRAAMTALAKVAARNSHKAPAGKCYGAVLGPQASAYAELAASEHGSKLYKQMADSIPSSHTSYAVQLAHWLLSKGKDGVTAADKMGFRVIEADGKTTLGQYLAKRPELKGAIAVVPYGQQGTASREWNAAAAYGDEKWGRGVGDVCVVTGTGAQPRFVADGGIRHERATMWWLVHPK